VGDDTASEKGRDRTAPATDFVISGVGVYPRAFAQHWLQTLLPEGGPSLLDAASAPVFDLSALLDDPGG
jgi:hypothetical protein